MSGRKDEMRWGMGWEYRDWSFCNSRWGREDRIKWTLTTIKQQRWDLWCVATHLWEGYKWDDIFSLMTPSSTWCHWILLSGPHLSFPLHSPPHSCKPGIYFSVVDSNIISHLIHFSSLSGASFIFELKNVAPVGQPKVYETKTWVLLIGKNRAG